MSTPAPTRKPRIILGTMTFGPDPASGARITSLDAYKSALSYFQSQGFNEVDTARCYVGGQQEAWTRAAGWKERGLKIATKWYPYNAVDDSDIEGAHRPERLHAMFDKSLSELDIDCVDIFYLHAPDRSTPFQESLRKMNELYGKGRFHQLGLSNYTAFEVAEIVMICKANDWVQPTIFQCVYNALVRSIEPELIAACRRYGLDIVVYNPIAGGLLTGKYTSRSTIPTEGRYSNVDSEVGELYRDRYFKDTTFDALDLIDTASKKHGLTMIEVAFRWLLHHSALNMKDGGNDGLVIGVSSQAQLEQNLDLAQRGPLPDEVVTALDQAWAMCRGTAQPYWHNALTYTYDTKQALASLA